MSCNPEMAKFRSHCRSVAFALLLPTIVILPCIIGAAQAQSTQPEGGMQNGAPNVAPNGAANGAPDLSSPKQTIAAMFAAVAAADTGTIKRVFRTETPQSADLAAAYADLIMSARRLREAVRAKYAADPPNPAMVRDGTTPGQPSPEQAAQLAAATVEIKDDTATVQLPDRPMPIQLQKVNGEWLIDMAAFAAANPQQLGEQVEIDRSLAAVMQETSDEITAGKYASAQEAESAIQQKIHAVIAPQIKSLSATTTTTTQSATMP